MTMMSFALMDSYLSFSVLIMFAKTIGWEAKEVKDSLDFCTRAIPTDATGLTSTAQKRPTRSQYLSSELGFSSYPYRLKQMILMDL